MPRTVASAGVAGAYGSPRQVIRPDEGVTTPVIMFISVDLPAPFSPIRPRVEPCYRAR